MLYHRKKKIMKKKRKRGGRDERIKERSKKEGERLVSHHLSCWLQVSYGFPPCPFILGPRLKRLLFLEHSGFTAEEGLMRDKKMGGGGPGQAG